MKGLRFRLFNTQPGHKAALKEEESRRDRERKHEREDVKGIGLTMQRDRIRWYMQMQRRCSVAQEYVFIKLLVLQCLFKKRKHFTYLLVTLQ